MVWFWTDDLAAALIEAGDVSPEQVASWVANPQAVRATPGDTLETARRLWEAEQEALPLAG